MDFAAKTWPGPNRLLVYTSSLWSRRPAGGRAWTAPTASAAPWAAPGRRVRDQKRPDTINSQKRSETAVTAARKSECTALSPGGATHFPIAAHGARPGVHAFQHYSQAFLSKAFLERFSLKRLGGALAGVRSAGPLQVRRAQRETRAAPKRCRSPVHSALRAISLVPHFHRPIPQPDQQL